MAAHSKHAWLAFGLSLAAAGTAYAAIPDANGVIRGCYNVLTGSARIVDGNSCGLLEKTISWQQTGPRGPAGATGAQGPVGPAGASGNNNIVVGHGALGLQNPVAPARSAVAYLANQPLTAPSDGFCNMTVSGMQLEFTGQTVFQPVWRVNGGEINYSSQTGVMVPSKRAGTSQFEFLAAASTTDTIEVEAGRTYQFGVAVSADAEPIAVGRTINFSFAWTCQFED